ncbi:MAG: hypothetical protein JWM95_1507 [Gemmatimonadetes bacterium]|nr:hypothetical protein [Gemmatimonadota bacterium]
MKLAISSLAWDPSRDHEVRALMSARGVAGVEIAPLKYWPWLSDVSPRLLAGFREQWSDAGISVVALQGILFGMPELQLFGTPEQRSGFERHVIATARVAAELGARVIVLGAPGNRIRGSLSEDDAVGVAAPILRRIAAAADELGCVVGIEPNPPLYGGDFVRTSAEALRLVWAVDHPGFALHLDAGALQASGETDEAIIGAAQAARHFHISEIGLAPVGSGSVRHGELGALLQKAGYVGWTSIEMRPVPGNELLGALDRAIDVAIDAYR